MKSLTAHIQAKSSIYKYLLSAAQDLPIDLDNFLRTQNDFLATLPRIQLPNGGIPTVAGTAMVYRTRLFFDSKTAVFSKTVGGKALAKLVSPDINYYVDLTLPQFCLALALGEGYYRSRRWPFTKGSLPSSGQLQQNYAVVLEDIACLSFHIKDAWATTPVLATPGKSVCHNATFSIPGIPADAQMIFDGTLIDTRTTNLARPFNLDKFIQILGYLLLDNDNEYNLKRSASYYTRHRAVMFLDFESLGITTEWLTAWRDGFYDCVIDQYHSPWEDEGPF
jgi:hypothetical protein